MEKKYDYVKFMICFCQDNENVKVKPISVEFQK